MCQRDVERVIGRLVTDEAFLSQFAAAPALTLRELIREGRDGIELNECEVSCLLATDVTALKAIAKAIDPRLRKAALCGSPRRDPSKPEDAS